MEHQIPRILRVLIFCLVLVSLAGCKREDPKPEMKDPIYQDLTKEYRKHEKWLEEAKKRLVVAEKELEAVKPRSLDRKIKTREYQKLLKEIRELEQMTKYYEIKADLRRVYGRKAYKVAFHKGESWPLPEEFEDYKTNKRLREASRNWSDRVPKSKHQQLSIEDMTKGSE